VSRRTQFHLAENRSHTRVLAAFLNDGLRDLANLLLARFHLPAGTAELRSLRLRRASSNKALISATDDGVGIDWGVLGSGLTPFAMARAKAEAASNRPASYRSIARATTWCCSKRCSM